MEADRGLGGPLFHIESHAALVQRPAGDHVCAWALTADMVSTAACLTARFRIAGFRIGHYPDNSVVCHAHRLAGGKQDIFPGGSAMVVDAERADTLFPPVYNEDWLFLYDAVGARSVAVAGDVSQLEYQPFANSRRAASEEFGD